MFIFHKTVIQTVILRCLTGLNLNCSKKYGLICQWRPRTGLANPQKIPTGKWPFYTMFGHCFTNCMFVFHKTELQKIILSCLRSLNLYWYKIYDTKGKNAYGVFVQNCKKNKTGNICFLCHNLQSNQILDLLSTLKRPSEPQFCEL